MGAKPYPAYKNSGVEWIGDIPEHWEVINARRICKQSRRKAHIGDQQLSATQKYGVIPQSLYSQLENSKLVAALGGTDNFIHVDVDNFVISLRSFQGGLERCMYSGSVSPAYTVLTLESFIHPNHFQYLAKSTDFVSALQSVAVGIREGKTINYEQLVLLSFPTPPLEEQQLIASFLDRETGKIDTLVEQQQKLISLLKDKRQSLISHIVTKGLNPNVRMKDSGVEWIGEIPEHWEVKRLKDVADCRLSNVDKHTVDGEPSVYLCNYVDVYKNDFITSDISFMAATATDRQISRLGIQVDDVLITKDSESPDDIGVPALVRTIVPSLVCGYHLALIRTDGHVQDGAFTFRYLASKSATSQFQVLAKGITRYAIGKGEISRLFIPSSPLEEQKLIAAFLDSETSKIDTLIDKANQSITLLKERRSSLISAAVTGKIDVREAA
jgi:type I restriction enzyme S subunit